MPEISPAVPHDIWDLTGTWALDPRRTTVQFQTKHMWVLNVSGTLRATEGSGAVDGDGQVTGRLVVDAGSIDTKNKVRDAHLRGADFFAVEKHPVMVFDVTGARLGAHGHSTVGGVLSIRGVPHPVDFNVALRMECDGALTVDAQAEIDRSKWGMAWARMGAGLTSQVTVKATFVRSSAGAW
jgi:polyisoprenoid-binding protein YceI